MNHFDECKEITVPLVLSEDTNDRRYPDIKTDIQMAIEKFHVKIEQLPNLLGIPMEKIESILQDSPCVLKEEEVDRAFHRLIFLSKGFSFIDETERVRSIINSTLVEEFHFSYESLARYADVPDDILKDFCKNRTQIEPQYLTNICVNLLMLHFILHS